MKTHRGDGRAVKVREDLYAQLEKIANEKKQSLTFILNVAVEQLIKSVEKSKGRLTVEL